MYLYDEDFKAYRLRRLMIHKDYQYHGYGKMALLELKKSIKDNYHSNKLYTIVKPQNNVAKKLYKKVGFTEEGVITRNLQISGRFYDALFMGYTID